MAAGWSFADNIVPTFEPAGVQTPNSTAICAGASTCIVGTETFDFWFGGGFSTDFGTGNEITGTYRGGFQSYAADDYGGAGGGGRYPEIFPADGSYTLTLGTASGVPGVNYFGLWFSALDGGNLLQFYQDSTLLYSFTPDDFIALVGACPGSNAFCGNPNNGADSGEQFAFLNFFDTTPDGYFNRIVFSQTGGGGFESDNHTVGYQDPPNPTGNDIYTPEPGSLWLFAPGGIVLALLAGRRRNRAVARAGK